MVNIREKVATSYNAERVGLEDYSLLEQMQICTTSYGADGKCTSVSYDRGDGESIWDGKSIIRYHDGLPSNKICNGIYVGEYTHKTTDENIRIETYQGDDRNHIREYDGEKLIFEHDPDYTNVHEYGYDENQRIIWHKIAITNYSGSIGGFDDDLDDEDFFNEDGSFKSNANDCSQFIETIDYIHEEYIYQDDKLYKRVCYKCDAPSLLDFLNGDYTINDNEIVDEEKYVETEEVVGDERVVTVKSYRTKDNALNSKTISTYDDATNCIYG